MMFFLALLKLLRLVTEALNAYQKWKGDSSKYMPLVSGLVGDVGIDLRYVIVSIINTLLASVDDLEARFEIRNEIVGLGLLPMLQVRFSSFLFGRA